MKPGRYRTGIVGLGRIGFTLERDRKREQPASHSRAFSENPSAFVAGGYDVSRPKRKDFALSYPGAKVYGSLEKMLSDGKWDILVVAVDEPAHLPVMKQVLAASPRLVVLEKPVAPNLREAEKILKLAEKRGVPVCVNHERRFSKDYLAVREAIAAKRYGKLAGLNATLLSPLKAVYPGDAKLGRGCLIHDGTHILDIAGYLTGKKIEVEHVSPGRFDKHGGLDGVSVSGSLGEAGFHLLCGYCTEPFTFEIDLQFERGRIRIGNGLLEFYESRESPYYEGFRSLMRDASVKPIRKTGYFSGMAQNCIDFLDGKSPLLSPLPDGVRALKTIEKILSMIED